MNEREKRLSDKKVGLLLEMACEDRVQVDEAEIGVQESPVCDTKERGRKVVFKPESSERCERSMNDRQGMTYSSEFLRLSVTRLENDRGGGEDAGAAGWASGASDAGERGGGASWLGYQRARGSSGLWGDGTWRDDQGDRTLAGEDREKNSCQQIAGRAEDCDRRRRDTTWWTSVRRGGREVVVEENARGRGREETREMRGVV